MGLYSGGRIYGGGRLIFRILIGFHICGAHFFGGGGGGGGGGVYRGGLIFGMLIDLDIWWTYIRGGDLYTRGAFTGFYDVNKLYKTLDYRSGNTLNFNFSEKSLALVSTLHFAYESFQ